MRHIFSSVVNQSLIASYVVIAVLVVRMFLRRQPKLLSYLLWLVVLFRLLCPWAVVSPLSLVPQSLQLPVGGTSSYDMQVVTSPASAAPAISNVAFADGAVANWLTMLWLGGMLLLLLSGAISAAKLRRRLAIATLVANNIFETDLIQTPFVFGLFSPRIFLPTGLSPNERDYIIQHEQMHIRRFDHVVRLIGFLALALHWFNPLVWLAHTLMIKDMEMSCDESVIAHATGDIRANYSSSLLAFSVRQSGLHGLLAFGERNITARVRNALNYRRPRFWLLGAACLVVLIVAIGLLTNQLGGVTYKDDQIGYSLVMPRSFARDIEIREQVWDSLRILNFVYKPVQALEPDFPYGTVGRVEIYEKTPSTEESLQHSSDDYGLRIVGENSRYYFGVANPTDVQFPLDAAAEIQSRYHELSRQFNEVIKSLRVVEGR